MTRALTLPYGKDRVDVKVRDGVRFDLLASTKPAGVAEPATAVAEALARPIGKPPLREIVQPGETVAILVNDITRLTRTDLMLPPILDVLNEAGVPDRDIFVVFALGIHRQQTEAEQRQIVGDTIYARIRCFDHICTDDRNLITIGKTSFGNVVEINRTVWEADRIILTGEIVYHLIAGYSGGRKSLVPGVAGKRTTTFNHSMIFDPRSRSGVLDGNPAHEDLLEACRMIDPDFIVNVVLSPEGDLIRVVAGHYDLAHREGCQTVDSMLRADFDAPFDVLIASAGGHPIDIDLRQAHKGLENACYALRPGGTILFFAECPNGAGIRAFEEFVQRYDDESQMEDALKREFVVGGHKAYWVVRLGRRYDVRLVSSLDSGFVERCHYRPVRPERAQRELDSILEECGPGARIGVISHAGFVLPAQNVTKEAVL